MRWHDALLLSGLGVLAGCAQAPVQEAPTPIAAAPPALVSRPAAAERAIAKYRQLAIQSNAAGDLAAAVTQWHFVTMLAPDDAKARRELESTRAAARRGSRENTQSGLAALRNGDAESAAPALARALALDPENADAAKGLRDIDRQKISRIQGERAAKLKPAESERSARTPVDGSDSYDVEQRLEMFRAGDVNGGLHELRAFVDAHPNARAARQRIAAAVYERASELESKGSREQALGLCEQAIALRGDAPGEWATRMQTLRKGLSDDYYDKGMRLYRTDVAGAIKQWETSLRYDPQNVKTSSRLREARLAQDKLKRIEGSAGN